MKRQTPKSLGLHILLSTILSLTYSYSVFADELQQASTRLCDHFRACMQTEMTEQGDTITPSMQAMLDGMVQELCSDIMDMNQVLDKPDLETAAIACLDSMSNSSCQVLDEGSETQACRDYQNLAEEYFPNQ